MQIKNLTMSFGTQVIFNDVSLNIPENEKIGVVGLNGAGKTTLFKIIMGFESPDMGKVYIKNNYRVDWLPQMISDDVDNMEIGVLDYLMSGRPIDKLNARLQDLYDELADSKCNQKEIFNEIEKIQKKLDYWDCYNADTILLKII